MLNNHEQIEMSTADIRALIARSGLSVYRVARLAGIPRGTLSPALAGTRPMPRSYGKRIGDAVAVYTLADGQERGA